MRLRGFETAMHVTYAATGWSAPHAQCHLKLPLSLISMRFPVLYVQSWTYKGSRRSILGHAGAGSPRRRKARCDPLARVSLSGPARSFTAGT